MFKGIEATVVSLPGHGTVRAESFSLKRVSKYGKLRKSKTAYFAGLNDEIEVKTGDKVLLRPCRPLSKTKSWVVVNKI